MANTTNLDLVKPLGTDHALVAQINSNSDKIDAEAGKARANFAAEYSASSAYAVGAFCTHNGILYQCNTAIGSGGEAWTAGHWTQISAGDAIVANNQAIATLNSNKQDKSSLFIKSSSTDATQTFDISNKGFSNPVFMLTIGFATSGLVAIVYLNSMSETNISYQKISNVGNLDISSMSYNASGTITVTFSGNPYRKGCLTVLNW